MKLLAAAGLLATAVLLHFYAVFFGLYELQMQQGNVWFDNLLHAGVGTAFALVWLILLEWLRPAASRAFCVVSALLFVLVLAVFWELFEHAFFVFFHTHALGLRVYPQPLSESVWDSLSNLAGAALFLLLSLRKKFQQSATVE